MGERLERWKSLETARVQVGWLAVLLGLGGSLMVMEGVLLLAERIAGGEAQASGLPLPARLAPGLGLLFCARGLWRAQPWARWAAVLFIAASTAQPLPAFVRRFELHPGLALAFLALLVPLGMIAYLLLPSTGRFFAREQDPPPRAKLFPG